MTESKSQINQAAAPGTFETKPPATGTAGSPSAKGASSPRKKRSILGIALIALLLLALALGVALWYTHQAYQRSSGNLLSQTQRSVSTALQANEQAQRAVSMTQAQSAQIATLQRSLHEIQGQQQILEQAFQALTQSGSDLVLVNDIDHLVTIANQQLLLSGNVANAVAALETAQAQLARANRPGLASLQQTINGDLDRLRAVSTIDVGLLSSRLGELGRLIDRAPLLIPDNAASGASAAANRPATAAPSVRAQPVDPDAPWWRRAVVMVHNWSNNAWASVRQDMGELINVRRVKDPSALLLSPEQAGQFRENLQLRIMTAQLALMIRQPRIWEAQTQTLVQALDTRYDDQAIETEQALKLARQLAGTSIRVELPTVNNSLRALEALRQASAQAAEQKSVAPPVQPTTQGAPVNEDKPPQE